MADSSKDFPMGSLSRDLPEWTQQGMLFCPKLCVFDIFKLAMIFARVFCLYKCFPVLLRVLFKAMITEDAELR